MSNTCAAPLDFDSLYRTFAQRVEHFVLKYVGWNVDDAKEVTQTAFMEAIQSQGGFSGNSSPYTWICAIARNCAFACTKRSVQLYSGYEINPDLHVIDECADPALLYEVRQSAARVQIVFDNLSRNFRDVYESVVQDGLSYEDAAGKFDVPIGTIRSRVSRVRQRLMEVV